MRGCGGLYAGKAAGGTRRPDKKTPSSSWAIMKEGTQMQRFNHFYKYNAFFCFSQAVFLKNSFFGIYDKKLCKLYYVNQKIPGTKIRFRRKHGPHLVAGLPGLSQICRPSPSLPGSWSQ